MLMVLIYGFANFDKGITGRVSLELESIYEEGQILEGILKIPLREGELIPLASKVVFENNEQIYEYNLNEITSEELTSGNFYVEGTNLSGNGEGFGIKGKKTIYPKVYFKLNIFSAEENLESASEEAIFNEIEPAEEVENETIAEEESKIIPITGGVILSAEVEISGEVFADNDFSYNLETGQSAELVSGSVITDDKNLGDSEINLHIEGNKIIISTDYSETEEGFGEDYLGENVKVLSIDLSNFEFKGKSGELKVSLIYDNEELIFLTTTLNEDTIPEINVNSLNDITEEENNAIKETSTIELGIALSEEEKRVLAKEFGNQSIKITDAEKTSEDIIVRFEIEDYWVEHHYDSLTSNEFLKLKVEEDRIRFLKDLANKFLEEEITGEKIRELIGSYEI